MTALVLLIGEDNPYGGDPRFALYPYPRRASGHRLMTILGVAEGVYLDDEAIARTNLCPEHWSAKLARKNARAIHEAPPAATVVLLGRKVAEAFGAEIFSSSVAFLPFTATYMVKDPPVHYVALPHPSGRCTEWNAPGAVERARRLMRTACPAIAWGSPTA